MVMLRSAPAGYEELSRADQVAMLRKRYAGAGWQTQRILDALDPETLEFQPVAQVRTPAWSKGRVVLLGDAAYAPSPLTGKGTSLALIGAYLLAGELGRGDEPAAAFQPVVITLARTAILRSSARGSTSWAAARLASE